MEPGNLAEQLEDMAELAAQLADVAQTARHVQKNMKHWKWVASAYEARSRDLLYALIELNHHFFEHGLSRGSLTVRTQEVLTAMDLGGYGAP